MDSKTIKVMINGEFREVPANQCVAALLDWLNVPSDRVAVELNKSIVRRRDWETADVGDGARVEIVEFVGGG